VTNGEQQEGLQRQDQPVVPWGTLVPGVAHDLNNALGAIIGHADILLENVTEKQIREHLATIKKAAGKAALLTQQLMETVTPRT
jgi:nitrogen-specific signal transduction histidine kinase